MVDYQQQIRLLQQRQQQLEQQKQRTVSARALRTIDALKGLVGRQQAAQQISQAQSEVAMKQAQFEDMQKQTQQSQVNNDLEKQYLYGRKLAMSGKGAYGLTPTERQGYIDAKEGLNAVDKYKKDLANYQSQQISSLELQPISSQVIQEPVQGPLPKAPSGYSYDESKFRTTGKLELTKDNVIQGPVQRFQDEQYFRETGKGRPASLVVYGAKTPSVEFKELKQDISQAYKENRLPDIIRLGLGRGTELLIKSGSIRAEEGLRRLGVGADSPLYKTLPIPASKIAGEFVISTAFAPGFLTTGEQLPVAYKLEPTYKTSYSTLVSPKGDAFETVTFAQTARTLGRKTDMFETVITEKGVAKEPNYFTVGEGITRPKGGTEVSVFKTTSGGVSNEVSPFALKEIKFDEFKEVLGKGFIPFAKGKAPESFILKGFKMGLEIPGGVRSRGLAASLEKDTLTIEKTGGFAFPIAPDSSVYLNVGAGGISGNAKGITFFLKEPIKDTGYKFIKPAVIQKTPFSVTFPKAIVKKSIENLVLPTPQIIKFKPVTFVTTKTTTKPVTITKERTSSQFIPSSKYQFEFEDLSYGRTSTGPRLQIIDITKPKDSFRFKTDFGLKFGTSYLDFTRPKDISKPSQSPFEIIGLGISQESKQAQAQQFNFGRPGPTIPRFPRPNPNIPKTGKPIIPILFDEDSKKNPYVKAKGIKSMFFIVSKTKGKEKIFGSASTFKEALTKGIGLVKGTLRASLKIKTPKGYAKLPTSTEFIKSKTDPFAIVQKRSKRLSSYGEKSEIRRARKTKTVRFFK